MTDQSAIQSLHNLYCALTGISVPLSMSRIYQWEAWIANGWTAEQLRSVINMLREKIRKGPKTIACLRFSNLIGNTEWFEEDLGEAQARERERKPRPNREAVLRMTGRQEPDRDIIRTPAQLLASEADFKKLLALRDSL